MNILSTLFPVFFMIVLGFISRIKNWISPKQKEGANQIVFNVLFPIMIFNILFSAKIKSSSFFIVIYVFIVFVLAIIVGKIFGKLTHDKTAHISPYLLSTCEGGNVALPLFTSIVGLSYASYTVIFDIAGSLIAFVMMPILVAKESTGQTSFKSLLKAIFTNSFVIAVGLGLIFNLVGLYDVLMSSSFKDIYLNTVNQTTAPIIGMILFIIGYNLKINKSMLHSLLKLISIRFVFYLVVIAGFFIFFPHLMNDSIYRLAVIIYFMCPTGFAVPMLISPLNHHEEDEDYQSAFISMYMIITLIVYIFAVILFK